VPVLSGAEAAPAATDLSDRTREVLDAFGLWNEALAPAAAAADAAGPGWPPF
jgi:hypothetical protein